MPSFGIGFGFGFDFLFMKAFIIGLILFKFSESFLKEVNSTLD
jgi:hypothetical protein